MAAVRPESDDERLRTFVLKCYAATAIDHITVVHHGAGRVLLTIYVDDLNPIVGPAGHKLETVRQALEDKSGRQVALHVVSTRQRYAPPSGWVQPLWELN
jgi:ribosomal protein S3